MITIILKKVNKIGVNPLTKLLMCAIIMLSLIGRRFYYEKKKPHKRYEDKGFWVLFCYSHDVFQSFWDSPWNYRERLC